MINVQLLQLPYGVKGFSTENEDGSHTIILNSRLSHCQHLKTYKHELSHIKNSDFNKDDIDVIEFKTREEAKK